MVVSRVGKNLEIKVVSRYGNNLYPKGYKFPFHSTRVPSRMCSVGDHVRGRGHP